MSGEGQILDLFRGALTTVALVGAPFVITALAVGLLVALLQAATQLQENALSFVPKIVAVGLVLVLAGPWVLGRLVRYAENSFSVVATLGKPSGPGGRAR